MSDKIIAWLRGKIAEAAPPAELEAGEIGGNIASLAQAMSTLRAGGATLFGLGVAGEALDPVRSELIALTEAALTAWKQRLEAQFGDEGRDTFATIALRHGLTLTPLPAPRRDPDVSRALARVFTALDDVDRATRNARAANRWVYEDDERLAYHVVREPDPIGFAQLAAKLSTMPPQLEGLYAELDELVIGASGEGGRSDDHVADFALIEPVAQAEVIDVEAEPCVVLHHHDMGRLLLLRLRDGAVLQWISKFEDHPSVVAVDLASYFDRLAQQLSA